MTDELKPCPFCGGEAEYHSDKGPTGEVYGWVGCNQCDAMSVHCDVRSMQPEETHPIDAWNTRADDARIAALEQRVRELEDTIRVAAKWFEVAAINHEIAAEAITPPDNAPYVEAARRDTFRAETLRKALGDTYETR